MFEFGAISARAARPQCGTLAWRAEPACVVCFCTIVLFFGLTRIKSDGASGVDANPWADASSEASSVANVVQVRADVVIAPS